MAEWPPAGIYSKETLLEEGKNVFSLLRKADSLDLVRETLRNWVSKLDYTAGLGPNPATLAVLVRIRDCARAFMGMIRPASDERSGFSVVQALWDLAKGIPRDKSKELQRPLLATTLPFVIQKRYFCLFTTLKC